MKDITGKKISGKLVFSYAIGYLRKHVIDQLEHRNTGVPEEYITWVITVPAIWDDACKQFMKQSAQKVCIEHATLNQNLIFNFLKDESRYIYIHFAFILTIFKSCKSIKKRQTNVPNKQQKESHDLGKEHNREGVLRHLFIICHSNQYFLVN